MKNDSQIIASLFSELRQFNRDTALLLPTAEDIFKRQGWTPPPQLDKTCRYHGSNSLDKPDAWLPYRFFRSYINPAQPQVLAFIAILIDLPQEDERTDGSTILTSGGLTYKQSSGWGKGLMSKATKVYRWHLFLVVTETITVNQSGTIALLSGSNETCQISGTMPRRK